MSLCSVQVTSTGLVSSVMGFIDCQAQMLGADAWHALSLPGSIFSIVLNGLLTIFIAVIGYNLLLGRLFTLRSATVAMLKIGVVLALATSWPAYHTLVYDLVIDGPTEIVGEIGRPSAVPGADGTLIGRLDATDNAIAQLAISGVGIGIRDDLPPPPFGGFNAFALGGSRILFLIAAIASLGGVRLISGLMLALGPFFVAFVLFDATRSLFEGWIRVIAGAALAGAGVPIALGFELAMLQPWLAGVLARRVAGEDLPTVPVELFVITCISTIVIVAILIACTRLVRAFRLPPLILLFEQGSQLGFARSGGNHSAPSAAHDRDARNRAAALADVLFTTQRRETHAAISSADSSLPGQSSKSAGSKSPLGRSFARRPQLRMAASSTRRDGLQ